MLRSREKGKGRHTTDHEGPEREKKNSSTLSLTPALDGWVVNATPRPLYPRERYPVPIVEKAGWAPGPVWRQVRKMWPSPGFDPRIVKPVANTGLP